MLVGSSLVEELASARALVVFKVSSPCLHVHVRAMHATN
jgi:hypothetical protein